MSTLTVRVPGVEPNDGVTDSQVAPVVVVAAAVNDCRVTRSELVTDSVLVVGVVEPAVASMLRDVGEIVMLPNPIPPDPVPFR